MEWCSTEEPGQRVKQTSASANAAFSPAGTTKCLMDRERGRKDLSTGLEPGSWSRLINTDGV